MRISREHGVTKAEAKLALDKFIVEVMAEYGSGNSQDRYYWNADVLEFSLNTTGLEITGSIEVSDIIVILEVTLPSIAKVFEPLARKRAELALDTVFQQAN